MAGRRRLRERRRSPIGGGLQTPLHSGQIGILISDVSKLPSREMEIDLVEGCFD